MAYSITNPPMMSSTAPLTGADQFWAYRSPDAAAAVDTAGYITNAKALGMHVGDIVFSREVATGIVTSHRVVTINATTGAADLGDGVVVGSVTNTD